MAASPHLRPERNNPGLSRPPVTYNSADAAERTAGGPQMTEHWKQWEGQIVDGQFRLQQYLGGSEHSAVFLTERAVAPQKAAIKLIAAGPDAEQQIFHWRLATKLPHTNLLRIFETGRCEISGTQLLYIVMEHAEEDLSQILPHRPLTPEEAKQMLLPLLDVLGHIHGKGFIHGHIKPSNILAIADQIKISSDTIIATSEPHPHPPQTLGPYDAPEIVTGTVSAAADVWSLAVTLTEVLTLCRPTGKEVPKEMPPPFRDIARQCLLSDPHSRCTIREIKSRLEQPSATVHSRPAVPDTRGLPKYLYLVPFILAALIFAYVVWPKKPSAGSSKTRTETQHIATEAKAPAKPPSAQAAKSESKAAPPAKTAPSAASRSAISSAPLVPGTVVQQVLPNVPQSAKGTITGRIKIRVKASVDVAGNVSDAKLESAGPSKYFARLALQAAQGWKFTPAQRAGQPVPSEWTLHFTFTSTGIDVQPVFSSR